MKKTLIGLGAALLLGMAGNAVADTIDYHVTYDPTNFLMNAAASNVAQADIAFDGSAVITGTFLPPLKTFNLNFDITGDPNYTADQIFNAGTITLTLTDDGGPGDGSEKATFTITLGNTWTAEINPTNFSGLSIASTAYQDGHIYSQLLAKSGDFYFDKVELNITNTTPVPEPASLLLLGTGLVGLGGVVRKRRPGQRG